LKVRVTALLALAAIAAVPVGCGDSDEDSSAASADRGGTALSASETEFASEANAICARAKRQLGRDLIAYSSSYRKRHPDKRAAADAFPSGLRRVGVPALQALADELRALEPPSEDGGGAEAYLDELEAAIASARERERIDEDQFVQDFETSRELARKHGIGACAFGG
jgi:hypothetical protein